MGTANIAQVLLEQRIKKALAIADQVVVKGRSATDGNGLRIAIMRMRNELSPPKGCPFDEPDHGIGPNDPCPVCGDLNDFETKDGDSNCVSGTETVVP